MAVYIDTEQVAGIAGIPSLTLEQYNALEVKPKLWFLLNPPEGYQRLSADEVSYDGTNSGLSATNTQGAIDEVNGKTDELDDIKLNKTAVKIGFNPTRLLDCNSNTPPVILNEGFYEYTQIVPAPALNKPTSNSSGYLKTYSWDNPAYGSQLFIDQSSSKIYMRTYSNGTWTAWVQT